MPLSCVLQHLFCKTVHVKEGTNIVLLSNEWASANVSGYQHKKIV